MSEFADYLGIKRPSLSQWMSGRNNPSLENALQLAQTLGPEIFDYLDLELDDDLLFIYQNWERVNGAERRRVREQIEAYLAHAKPPEVNWQEILPDEMQAKIRQAISEWALDKGYDNQAVLLELERRYGRPFGRSADQNGSTRNNTGGK